VSEHTERVKVALAGEYRIEREIGRGAAATVYLVHDLKHDRALALKVLRPAVSASLGTERFLREIRILAQLQHPHILPLYDSGEAGGALFYIMPCIEGQSLRERLNKTGRIPLEAALNITREVADGLHYAHSHDVVHRDIKPENILLAEDHALITDFGIARPIHATGGARLTDPGTSVGTPTYMSPEQACGDRELDGRSDIYSLGCVLFEMLVGSPPFHGGTTQALVAQHMTIEAPMIHGPELDVPPSIENAIHTALEKDPDCRFATAEEFAAALVLPERGKIERLLRAITPRSLRARGRREPPAAGS